MEWDTPPAKFNFLGKQPRLEHCFHRCQKQRFRMQRAFMVGGRIGMSLLLQSLLLSLSSMWVRPTNLFCAPVRMHFSYYKAQLWLTSPWFQYERKKQTLNRGSYLSTSCFHHRGQIFRQNSKNHWLVHKTWKFYDKFLWICSLHIYSHLHKPTLQNMQHSYRITGRARHSTNQCMPSFVITVESIDTSNYAQSITSASLRQYQ